MIYVHHVQLLEFRIHLLVCMAVVLFPAILLLLCVQMLTDLATEGGKVFWVAPSGGRDRMNTTLNKFTVSDFDGKVYSYIGINVCIFLS